MKEIIYILAVVSIFYSCSGNNAAEPSKISSGLDSSSAAPVVVPKPVYSYPIKYTEWEIGKQEYIQIALDFYKAWDRKEAGAMAALFADTLRLRVPTERTEIVLSNARINAALSENRKLYDSTYNDIISAMSLHDRERNEDWVMITTYNKWVEKDGKRDSLLYHDEWRIRNGKIEFLWSFDKVPTKAFLKKNDPKNKRSSN